MTMRHNTLLRLRLAWRPCALSIGLALAFNAAGQVFRCVTPEGKVEYKDKACTADSRGASLSLSSNDSMPGATMSVPVPTKTTATPAQKTETNVHAAIPPDVVGWAKGRLDGLPKNGHGLVEGMSGAEVVRVWGRPHRVDGSIHPDAVFLEYCDLRIALIWKGRPQHLVRAVSR